MYTDENKCTNKRVTRREENALAQSGMPTNKYRPKDGAGKPSADADTSGCKCGEGKDVCKGPRYFLSSNVY